MTGDRWDDAERARETRNEKWGRLEAFLSGIAIFAGALLLFSFIGPAVGEALLADVGYGSGQVRAARLLLVLAGLCLVASGIAALAAQDQKLGRTRGIQRGESTRTERSSQRVQKRRWDRVGDDVGALQRQWGRKR